MQRDELANMQEIMGHDLRSPLHDTVEVDHSYMPEFDMIDRRQSSYYIQYLFIYVPC